MGVRRALTLVFALLALAAGGMLVHDLAEWRAIDRFAAALAADRPADAAALLGDRGRFAAAYALHRQGDHQAARKAYDELARSTSPRLRRDAQYNIGNTYLEQAAALDPKKDADRAIPLVELAKDSYRVVLAQDPQDWDARYNLQRALERSPDVPDRKLMELEGQRRPVRTRDTADPEGDLP